MTDEQSTTYSHDEIVSELTSFYEFLVGLHLPPSALKIPPPGGWPDLTPEYLAFLKKNDTVVDLMQHLPYIRQDQEYTPYQIYEKTCAVDYSGRYFQESATHVPPDPTMAEPIEEETTLPSHVMTLARTPGGRDGYFFFIDTERGTITMCDFQDGRPWPTKLSQVVDDDSKEDWRTFGTYTAKEFFEMLKEDYRSFKVMPTEPTDVIMVSRCSRFDTDRLKDIFCAYGWPSDNYRKEECMKKVKEAWDEM